MSPTPRAALVLGKALGAGVRALSQAVIIYVPAFLLGVMSLGCVLDNMWLVAQSLKIGFHVLSALSTAPTENEVKRILGIPDYLKIAFTCRVGYPLSAPDRYLRVRREVEDFTHYNRYGNKGLG